MMKMCPHKRHFESSLGNYRLLPFFDADELDRAIAEMNPATNLPIKPEDIIKCTIVDL